MTAALAGRPARPDRALLLGLAAILALTFWRVLWLPFDARDLFVDDAQYWLWGQDLAWGYFSKPPLIAWILRLSTEIGTDSAFWIRLPLPLLHAATACVVMALGRRLWDAPTGALAGALYASLPIVGVGSLLVSTDTPLLLAFAGAMLLQLRLAERPSAALALLWGATVGLGLLAKYAMLYYLPCAALAAWALPQARPRAREAALAAAAALALVAPNLAWNATNGFVTLTHTLGNAEWTGPALRWAALAEFLAAQALAAGPVVLGAWALALPAARRAAPAAFAALLSAPILLLVSLQALRAGANANWAAPAYVGVALLAAAALLRRPGWRAAALLPNLALALALPVLAAFGDRLPNPWGEDPLLARWTGRAAVSLRAADLARANGLDTIVAERRDLLADLFHTLRDAGLTLAAEPRPGPPAHFYAQTLALPPGGAGDVLYLTTGDGPACRPGAPAPRPLAAWTPEEGHYAGETVRALRVPRACWFSPPGSG